MKKTSFLMCPLLVINFLLSGCIDQQILDDVELTTAVGYDLISDDLIEATAVVPQYQPDSSVTNKTFSATSKLTKDISDKLTRQSSKPFVSGKLEVTLYSTELAKEGLRNIIDIFERDPHIGSRLYLVIAEGELKKQLNIQYGTIDNGMFLSKMIEHNVESGMLPKTNLHQFTKSLYSDGIDPFLPFIKLEGKVANIEGIAVFKEDKYIDLIPEEDCSIFKMLLERSTKDVSLSIELEEDSARASVHSIATKRSYKIKTPMQNPDIKINLDINAVIREYSNGRITKQVTSKIEKKMEKIIRNRANKMINNFQNQQIDPLGIGNQVKYQARYWDPQKWDVLYPDSSIDVKVNVKINQAGVVK
ncbi:spore germination protein [Bacillus pakistanensis]|uniref:Spore germination protein n=1 Tax=Rossellomorea pakistanensis TaxID=992288 RepID=A0ABS2N857_9BACI|nr:Ger(x)C family spore germination protein [Bacillus pakistanensis]MBM7584047.1 spore germination protein [Bacillus pakistanensis]